MASFQCGAELETQEEKLLAWRARKEHDQEARRTLIERNLPLVIHVAKRYRGRGLGFDDLIAAGNLGLIRAVDHYDPARSARLVRSAVVWIEEAIGHALIANEPLHVSLDGDKRYRRVAPYLDHCAQLQEAPNLDLLRVIAFPKSASQEKQQHIALQDQTLNAFLRRHAGRRVALSEDDHRHAAGDAEPDLAWLEQQENYEVIGATIDALDALDRDRQILKYRLGLYGAEAWSLKDTARAVGVSPERVRQIEKQYLPEIRAFVADRLGLDIASNGRSRRS